MLPKVRLLNRLMENGVIAIIRRVPEESVLHIAEALVAGGITALEVTVDTRGAFRTIEKLTEILGDRAIVGAGTVLDAMSARRAIDSGAEFLLSPSLHRDVIQAALRYGKIAIPGIMTPTEMIQAIEQGADLVKLFPAASLGAAFVKDVRAPFPHVPVVPTGGIDLSNVAAYIQAGSAAVGVGGSLMDRAAIQVGDYGAIKAKASQLVHAVREARASLPR